MYLKFQVNSICMRNFHVIMPSNYAKHSKLKLYVHHEKIVNNVERLQHEGIVPKGRASALLDGGPIQ